MRKSVVAFLRCSLLFTTASGLVLLWALGFLLAWPSRAARHGLRGTVFRTWARFTAQIIGMRLRVQGHPPTDPFLLVSNHLSYVDVVVFASQCNCIFVAKQEVSRWPGIGSLAKFVDTIFIDRADRNDVIRVSTLIESELSSGRSVVLFPEGTSSPGETVLPFNSSLLEAAAKTGRAVSYATLTYETPRRESPAHLAVCWWGDMTFMSHLFNLLKLSSFSATVVYGPEPVRLDNRKVLARTLWRKVLDQFIPVARRPAGLER
jgi:1-acyl-sn-glycerol-3-phosphate acyltransferase